MQVQLSEVRAAFLKLFEAKAVGQGNDKYFSAAFPILPASANAKAPDAAILAVSKEKWGVKAAGILDTIVEKGDIGYKKKPLKDAEGNIYDGFEGMHSLNASLNENKGRPTILDRDRTPLTEKDGKPYSGCYVNAIVDVWVQDNSFGKKINVQLKGVQFVRDGDAFGSGAPLSADAFADLGAPEESDPLVS